MDATFSATHSPERLPSCACLRLAMPSRAQALCEDPSTARLDADRASLGRPRDRLQQLRGDARMARTLASWTPTALSLVGRPSHWHMTLPQSPLKTRLDPGIDPTMPWFSNTAPWWQAGAALVGHFQVPPAFARPDSVFHGTTKEAKARNRAAVLDTLSGFVREGAPKLSTKGFPTGPTAW